MTLDTEYMIGEQVYLITDPDQRIRMIIGILVNPDGYRYHLVCGTTESWHYSIELSATKNILV